MGFIRAPHAWVLIFVLLVNVANAEIKNGFNLSKAAIPANQIFQGGPPRDGIPSIDKPQFVSVKDAEFLDGQSRVLGLVIGNQARAYPIMILDWHEIVNDRVGDFPVVITYCPLCGTGMAFDARVDGKTLEFGVSGLLYQSDVLLYDRESESLWSQVMTRAVTGDFKGQQLQQLPLEHTSWTDWLEKHPDTLVLSTDTGYSRNYGFTPYGNYDRSSRIYFDVNHPAPAIYHPKEQVLGIVIGGKAKAYPFKELSENGKKTFKDHFMGTNYVVHWNEEARSAMLYGTDNKPLVTTTAFWFAWYTFHPSTAIYQAE